MGDRGERIALRYLEERGYSLVEKNYRTRHGEIDLIVQRDQSLVFVEVKLRRDLGFGDPLEAVTPRKQATIRAMAEQYLATHEPDFDELRFDVVGILFISGTPEITHVADAF